MSLRMFRISRALVDLATLTCAFTLAFFLRFDFVPPTEMLGRLLLTLPYVVLGEFVVLSLFGVPRFSWRYIGLREVWHVGVATSVATAALVTVRLVLGQLDDIYPFLRHGIIPIGTLAMNAAFVPMGIVGARVLRRVVGERADRGRVDRAKSHVPTIVVGAGQGGVLVAKELANRPDVGLRAIGFVDDDLNKVGTLLNGLPVLGTTAALREICERHGVRQIVIAIANAPGGVVRTITEVGEQVGAEVQIVPGLYEIVDGRVNLSRIRPVAIADLLGRDPIVLDTESISRDLHGRVVLVTGAGGSIGSELCRQISRFAPSRLVLVEQAENGLFHIHGELRALYPQLELVPVIADVTDAHRVRQIFDSHQPTVVFHAAAHKHVPLMEWNPAEAVKNNVFGTQIVADAANDVGADSFVLISTDKAVNPSSVMGATKRVAEMYVQGLAHTSKTRFVTVRFGNVLGSAGSVVPTFEAQIARGGPVTVTHPDMRRYFMTIPEACQLVMQAGSMGDGGEVFVLDMGDPVKIVDLARDLITLSGLRAGEDIVIEFTGMRPGEKLFEELSIDGEHATKTKHPKIFVGRAKAFRAEDVREFLMNLHTAVQSHQDDRVRAGLRGCVPEYAPPTPTASPSPAPPSRPPNDSSVNDLQAATAE